MRCACFFRFGRLACCTSVIQSPRLKARKREKNSALPSSPWYLVRVSNMRGSSKNNFHALSSSASFFLACISRIRAVAMENASRNCELKNSGTSRMVAQRCFHSSESVTESNVAQADAMPPLPCDATVLGTHLYFFAAFAFALTGEFRPPLDGRGDGVSI